METRINSKKRIITIMTALCMLITCVFFQTDNVSAASQKTVTKSNKVLEADNGVRALDVYGKDVFKIVYNPKNKTIIRCSVGQQKKNLGTNLCEPGKIVCTKSTAKEKKYTSVWYLNFSILPKAKIGGQTSDKIVKKAMGKYAPVVVQLSDLGRIMKVTTTYTVKGDGSLIRNSSKIKFMVPSRLTDAAKKAKSLFAKKAGFGGR